MGGESWCTAKDIYVPFQNLKARHVDHLVSCIYEKNIYWTIFLGYKFL